MTAPLPRGNSSNRAAAAGFLKKEAAARLLGDCSCHGIRALAKRKTDCYRPVIELIVILALFVVHFIPKR